LSKRGSSIVEQPSLMHYAVILNLPNLLRSLISKGVGTGLEETSPDPDGTILRIAIMHGHDEISSILLRHKYYVTTASKKTHEVPFLLATRNSRPELVELLLSQGAASDLVLMPTKSNILGTYLSVRVKVDDNEPGWETEEYSCLKFIRQGHSIFDRLCQEGDSQVSRLHFRVAAVRIQWDAVALGYTDTG
jgi:hypothetical protein